MNTTTTNNTLKNKVIVTGAPGFLGSALVRQLLLQEREIICVIHPMFRGKTTSQLFPQIPQAAQLQLVFKDILAPQEEFLRFFQGAQTLFHCAGMQHPSKTEELYRTNTQGTIHLFKVCRAWGVRNFIHISSSTVFGSDQEALTESSPGERYFTHYHKSKIEADRLLQEEARKQLLPRLVILAPAVFYGSPPSANLQELLQRLRAGKPVPVIGNSLRSYVSISTVIEAMLTAEERGKHGDIFALADKKALTTREFYASLARGLDVSEKVISLPVLGSRLAEKMAYGLGKINRHSRYLTVLGELGRPHHLRAEKAEQELGVSFAADPAVGLEAMARAWRQEKK